MSKLFLVIAASVVLMAAIRSAKSEEPTIRYPRTYAAWKEDVMCRMGEPVFNCDYTTRTCLRGITNRGGGQSGYEFVGELLAEDRSTVIAHVMRYGNYWMNFDTGETTPPGVGPGVFGLRDDDAPPTNLVHCH
jgi:hypothetical protein